MENVKEHYCLLPGVNCIKNLFQEDIYNIYDGCNEVFLVEFNI